jgi:hypothetical protein
MVAQSTCESSRRERMERKERKERKPANTLLKVLKTPEKFNILWRDQEENTPS